MQARISQFKENIILSATNSIMTILEEEQNKCISVLQDISNKAISLNKKFSDIVNKIEAPNAESSQSESSTQSEESKKIIATVKHQLQNVKYEVNKMANNGQKEATSQSSISGAVSKWLNKFKEDIGSQTIMKK